MPSSPTLALAVLSVAITGCTPRREPAPRALAAKDEPAWRAQLIRERADKDHELATSPESVLAATERFTPTRAAFVRLDRDAVEVDDTAESASLIAFEPTDETAAHWRWRPIATAGTTDGKAVTEPTELTRPMRVQLSTRFAIAAQIAGGGLVITGFDRQRKDFVQFQHLAYFEPDPKLYVAARLERFAKPSTIDLATSRGLKKSYVRYGLLKFDLNGTPCVLTAFRPAGSTGAELFVPFRDTTSGKESYGSARFLDLEEPADRAAPVVLDFNEAYNPYCAYSGAYNCPMPPPENQLTVAVTAGERAYAGHP